MVRAVLQFRSDTGASMSEYENGQHEPPTWSVIAVAVMALFLAWHIWGQQ